jgi:hypothetical protein
MRIIGAREIIREIFISILKIILRVFLRRKIFGESVFLEEFEENHLRNIYKIF